MVAKPLRFQIRHFLEWNSETFKVLAHQQKNGHEQSHIKSWLAPGSGKHFVSGLGSLGDYISAGFEKTLPVLPFFGDGHESSTQLYVGVSISIPYLKVGWQFPHFLRLLTLAHIQWLWIFQHSCSFAHRLLLMKDSPNHAMKYSMFPQDLQPQQIYTAMLFTSEFSYTALYFKRHSPETRLKYLFQAWWNLSWKICGCM